MSVAARSAFIVTVAFVSLLLFLQPARSATIGVSSTADVIADDGVCTLREAIIAANTNTASSDTSGTPCVAGDDATTDTIYTGPGAFNLNIAGSGEDDAATGDLDILNNTATVDLIISSASSFNAIVTQNAADRVFQILSATVEFIHVKAQNGTETFGGGIYVSGTGNLTLTNSIVSGNSADSGGGVLVEASAALTVTNTSISSNTASVSGGGIYSIGNLAVSNSQITNNSSSGDGGGIYTGGVLSTTNTLIDSNSATGNGGGMYYFSFFVGAQVFSTSFHTNTATGNGDAFYYAAMQPASLSGNCFLGNGNPAVYNAVGSLASVTGNWWGYPDGANPPGSGDSVGPTGTWNTTSFLTQPPDICAIVVNTTDDENNTDGDCSLREAIKAANTNAQVDQCRAGKDTETDHIKLANGSLYSLVISGSSEDASDTGDLDVINNTFGLDLVLEASNNGAATISQDAATDDRVIHVLTGARAEIDGITITNGGNVFLGGGIYNQGTLQLSQSIVQSCAASTGGGGIYNAGTLNMVGSGITANTCPTGAGIYNNSITSISGSSAIYQHNGNTGAGIYNHGTLTFSASSIYNNSATTNGGGIYNDSLADIDGSQVYGNSATSGGGIHNAAAGSLTVEASSSIYKNSATNSGGGIYSAGTMDIENGTVIGGDSSLGNQNTAGIGGGIYISGATGTIDASTVGGNSATSQGGGIATNFSANLTIQNGSTIGSNDPHFGNHSSGNGGGICNTASTLNITNSSVMGNDATSAGGGLFNGDTTPATITGGTFSDNQAGTTGGGISNIGILTVQTGATLQNNSAQYGGAIHNSLTLNLNASTVTQNQASIQGGGIFTGNGGTTTITAGTLTDNQADFVGGAIANYNVTKLQTSGLVSGNSTPVQAGAVFNATTGSLTIDHITFQDNTAPTAAGILNTGTMDVQDSVFTGNVATIGGAIVHQDGTATIADSNFFGNVATSGNGSALFNAVDVLNVLTIHNSCIAYNEPTAAFNGLAFQDATGNWWRSADGPNPPGSGEAISGNWTTTGPLTAPPAFCLPMQTVYNGALEIDDNIDNRPDGFTFSKLGSADILDCITSPGDCVFKIKANGNTKKVTQKILMSGISNESFTLSVKDKTSKISSSGSMNMSVQFYLGNTLVRKFTKNFTSGTHDWETLTLPITTNGAYDNVKVIFKLTKDKGTVYWNDLSLVRNP